MLKSLIASFRFNVFAQTNEFFLQQRLCIHIWVSFKSIKLSAEFLLLFYFGVFNNIIINDKKCANDFNLIPTPTSRDVLTSIKIMM